MIIWHNGRHDVKRFNHIFHCYFTLRRSSWNSMLLFLTFLTYNVYDCVTLAAYTILLDIFRRIEIIEFYFQQHEVS